MGVRGIIERSKRRQRVRGGGGAGREGGVEEAQQRVLSYRRWHICSTGSLYPVVVREVVHSPCHRVST